MGWRGRIADLAINAAVAVVMSGPPWVMPVGPLPLDGCGLTGQPGRDTRLACMG